MSSEILTPVLPESVADATVVTWSKQVGDSVKQDEVLVEIETDKVVLEVPAPADGVLTEIVQQAGATVISSQLLGRMTIGAVAAAPKTEAAPVAANAEPQTAPAARKLMAENNLTAADVDGSGKQGRILKEDVQAAVAAKPAAAPALVAASAPVAAAPAPTVAVTASGARMEQRVPMTRLRARIAERLMYAKQSTAMLTTFNEIDMKPLMDMRTEYKDAFEKKHKAKLGFMSLFVKAAAVALQRFPKSMPRLMAMTLFTTASAILGLPCHLIAVWSYLSCAIPKTWVWQTSNPALPGTLLKPVKVSWIWAI